MNDYTKSNAYTAMCMWEYVQDVLTGSAKNPDLERYRNAHGASQFRQDILDLAPEIDLIWEMIDEEERECFDWEFVPLVMADHLYYGGTLNLQGTKSRIAAAVSAHWKAARDSWKSEHDRKVEAAQ